jgi:protein-disulfide isomerase
MNKGTAIVGFFMSFLAGMFLMWGIDRSGGMEIAAETSSSSKGSLPAAHASALIPVTSEDAIWGNPNAPVTIVEFSDFECPFCGKVNPTLAEIKKTYGPDKIRLVFKQHPLPFHKSAKPAHIAAVAVLDLGGSEAFYKFHDQAFANRSALTPENFKAWAVAAGVDGAKFEKALKENEGKYAARIEKDLAIARKVGASGTPAFRINGVTLSGAQPLEKFKEVIDQQLAEAKKLVADGAKPADVYPTLVAKNAKAAPEKAEEAEEQDNTVWKVPVLADDAIKGGKDALVTIVEFSEFQCPYCKRVVPTIQKIVETYGNDVRVVWKDNPLPFHPRALPAATLARVAYETKGEKAFWQVHDKLFDSQPKLEDADLQAIAEGAGISWANVEAAIKSNKYAAKFEESQDLSQDLAARGTPHFFVNGIRVAGALPFENFKTIIDAQLNKAKALVAKGVSRSKVYDELMKEGKEPPPPEKKDIAAPPSDAPTKGTGKVLIQEFSDFECPYCSRVNPTMERVIKELGSDVKVVWRNLPLPMHKNAPLAAEAAFEVYKQKGDKAFWEYHDKLFAAQREPGLERASLEKFAAEIPGVDLAKFKKALDDRTHKARIDADAQAAEKAGISGTPAFVVGGYFVNGAQPFSAFKKAIKLAKSGK